MMYLTTLRVFVSVSLFTLGGGTDETVRSSIETSPSVEQMGAGGLKFRSLETEQFKRANLPPAPQNPFDAIRVINDPDSSPAQRLSAEHSLLEQRDPELLRALLPFFRDPPVVGPFPLGVFPGTGQPESEAALLPAQAQIIYARDRVWRHLAQHAQPEERRKELFAELIDECESHHQFQKLVETATWNYSEALEERLWLRFAERTGDAAIRTLSASALSRITRGKAAQQIVEYAWDERGSEVAINIGGRFGGPRFRHPQLDLLKVDWYDHQRQSGVPETLVNRLDEYFGNITGLYVQRRGAISDEGLNLAREHTRLQANARETGDDAKLREFEAELAERQRQELQTRIERIDEWIAANRERLEQEAVAFKSDQQRRREQRPTRELPRPRER